jgi:hypothetical protein
MSALAGVHALPLVAALLGLTGGVPSMPRWWAGPGPFRRRRSQRQMRRDRRRRGGR